MKRKRFFKIKVSVLLLGILLSTVVIQAKPEKALEPPTPIQDQIIHNKGNIVTTVQNWGQIGGQSHLGKPSGEWPKGSEHKYLSEIKYWMGAVKPDGDTVVVTTDDDFMPIPMPLGGEEKYKIHLSTDSETYDYDPSDTVGLGIGKPAYGWRVWDSQSQTWTYNKVWDPKESTFFDGGPNSLQESHYRFNDANSGVYALGLEMTQTILQWNYSYNQDFLFVILEIKNISTNNYPHFAFGVYCDFDIGGYTPQGENGRLGDVVDFDSAMNLAWTYDEDGYDEAWGPLVKAGMMGTKYIQTPDNLGMTAFRTGDWAALPDQDPEMYAHISAHTFEQSLPPTDQYYIQCTSGINLEAGKTIRVVFALVAGQTEAELKDNASMAQVVYDNHFIGPEPPNPAHLVATSGNRIAKLSWDNVSENSVDPMSGEKDFLGYKIYRSTNMGLTWGDLIRNPDGSLGPDYVPIAIFQKEEDADILPHTYIDTNLTNGKEYWYSLVSYDSGDTSVPIKSLQTAFGRPGEDVNCAFAHPRTDPAGYYPISKTVKHNYYGEESLSDGTIIPTLFDPNSLTKHDYKVVFSENPQVTYWHVIDVTTGDTALKDQTQQSGDEKTFPVVDGIQVIVTNGEKTPAYYHQTGLGTATDTTLHMGYLYGPMGETFGVPVGGDMHFRSTYEIRFTQNGSIGYDFFDHFYATVTPIVLPFEVWNTSLGYQVIAEIYDQQGDGMWNPEDKDYIDIIDFPYDGNPHPEAFPYDHSWFFRFATSDTNYVVGDVFKIGGARLNNPEDEFSFSAPGIDFAQAKSGLNNIRVVPNPYLTHADWETNEGIRKIQFTHLPDICTIQIYTLTGDLVQTIGHNDGTGTQDWDLLSANQQGIAPGIYYYNVESKYGNKVGKFVVIK